MAFAKLVPKAAKSAPPAVSANNASATNSRSTPPNPHACARTDPQVVTRPIARSAVHQRKFSFTNSKCVGIVSIAIALHATQINKRALNAVTTSLCKQMALVSV